MITPQPAPSHLRGQHEEVVPRAGDGGEGEGGAGRLQASAPSRLCTQRDGGGGSG